MKVLVDASVIRHAIEQYPTVVERTVEWGGMNQTRQVHTMKPRKEQKPWLEEQIGALPTIAEAARAGRVKLFLAAELRMEIMNKRNGYLAWSAASVFAGISFDSVPPPFRYSRLVSSYLDRPGDPESDTPGDADVRWGRFLAETYEKDFTTLKAALGGNKNADALHILTTERAGLDCFLTTDKRLANSAARQRKIPLRVEVLTPTELVGLFASLPRDEMHNDQKPT